MVYIVCYMEKGRSRNLYPNKWPEWFPVKPEIGDKIESLDAKDIGVVIDITYKTDGGNGNVYAELHLSRLHLLR